MRLRSTWSILNLSIITTSLSNIALGNVQSNIGKLCNSARELSEDLSIVFTIATPSSFACDANILTQLAMKGATTMSCLCSSRIPLSSLSKHSRSLRISTAIRQADCTSNNVSWCPASILLDFISKSSQIIFRPIQSCLNINN